MRPIKPDPEALSRALLFILLSENPEYRRISLDSDKPDYALEDLPLSEWGRKTAPDQESESHAPAR